MKFDEILEKLKAEDPKIILDALDELGEACSEAAAEAGRACKAYYANAEEKKKKVVERIEELREHLEGCEIRIEALRKPLVAATVEGDPKKLDSIKAKMKELEVEKLQLSTEIGMLESTHITGDEDLYNKVVDKSAEHEKLCKAYYTAKIETHRLAGERIKDYEKIQRRTENFYAGGGNGPNMQELERHFHFEKYMKLEEEASEHTLMQS